MGKKVVQRHLSERNVNTPYSVSIIMIIIFLLLARANGRHLGKCYSYSIYYNAVIL